MGQVGPQDPKTGLIGSGEVFRPSLKISLTKTQTQDCAVKWCVFTAENMGYFRTDIAVIKR